MNIEEIIKSINYICLLISIFIFLILKFLKYLISKESLILRQEKVKIKKSESLNNSLYTSINSSSPTNQSI